MKITYLKKGGRKQLFILSALVMLSLMITTVNGNILEDMFNVKMTKKTMK
jgi:hypothetical protein